MKDRRWDFGDKRCEMSDRRVETKDRRQEMGDLGNDEILFCSVLTDCLADIVYI